LFLAVRNHVEMQLLCISNAEMTTCFDHLIICLCKKMGVNKFSNSAKYLLSLVSVKNTGQFFHSVISLNRRLKMKELIRLKEYTRVQRSRIQRANLKMLAWSRLLLAMFT